MIWTLFLGMGVAGQEPQLETDPGAIVTKMLAKYAYAQSLSGTIVQEGTDTGGTVRITTKISYVRPHHILLEQDKKGRSGVNVKVVSDDKKFMYPPPFGDTPVPPKPGEMLYEPRILPNVAPPYQPTILYIGDMYHAAHKSIYASTILDLAVSHRPHLEDFNINVATLSLAGMVSHKGKVVYRLTGKWQPYRGQNTVTGTFELLVSREFDAVKFTLREVYKVGGKEVPVTVTETAELKVDAEVDPGIFKVG